MAQTKFVNSRGVVHKGSGGISTSFPDVCKTPTPGGPVPIPYPNIGKYSDTTKGPKTVKIDHQMPMAKGSQYCTSTGDEPGTLGGVVSGVNKNVCEFSMYSFDVKFEGKNVCRVGDPLIHNKKNAMSPADVGESVHNATIVQKPCGIKSLEISCSHDGRKAKAGLLQVVADTTTTMKITPGIKKVKDKITEKAKDKITEKGIKTKWEFTLERKFGGKDIIEAKVETFDNSGPKEVCMETNSESEGSGWKGSPQKFDVPAAKSKGIKKIWPYPAEPDCYYILGRGCDKTPLKVRAESFPNQQMSGEVSLEIIDAWVEKVNEAWKKWGEKVFNASPATMTLKLLSPKGSVKGEWGWKEEKKDWRAYFSISLTLGLTPIFGIQIGIEVSMLAVASASAGIPPSISKFVGKHLADILISVSGSAKAELKGGPEAKLYSTGERKIEGEAVFSLIGALTMKLCARVGSDTIASLAVSAAGTVKLVGNAKGKIKSDGNLYFEPSAFLDKLEVVVVVTAKAFITWEYEVAKWQVWDKVDIYKGKEVQILPPQNS